MRVHTATWGPEEAFQLLDAADPYNRNIRQRTVDMYAIDMRKGRWNPNSLVEFEGDLSTRQGLILRNGHHRLWALASLVDEAPDTRCSFIVVDQLPPGAAETIDTGMNRTTGDLIVHESGKRADASQIAATLRLYWRWQIGTNGDPRRATQVSNRDLLDLYRLDPELAREAVKLGRSVTRRSAQLAGGPPSVYAAAWIHLSGIDPDDATEFFERLRTGVADNEHDPVLVLIRTVRSLYSRGSGAGSHASSPVQREALLALTVTAWNHFRAGTTVKRLVYRPRDPFPIAK